MYKHIPIQVLQCTGRCKDGEYACPCPEACEVSEVQHGSLLESVLATAARTLAVAVVVSLLGIAFGLPR